MGNIQSHKINYGCQYWCHFIHSHMQPKQDWYMLFPVDTRSVECVCGEIVHQYKDHKIMCSLIYDHFRRLTPDEIQEHFIAFSLGARPRVIIPLGKEAIRTC
jgi:hypothetical protein